MSRYFLLLPCVICLGLASVVLATPDIKDDPLKAALKELQGTWQMTKAVDNSGEAAPADVIKDRTWVFKGEMITGRRFGPPVKFKLDPTKQPRRIDIEVGPDLISEGIYKLDDDVLTMCLVADLNQGLARPTEFKANKGDKYCLFVFKRVKE